MIFTAILKLVYWIVLLITSPLRFLPNVSLPSGVETALSTAATYASALDGFIPIQTIFSVTLAFFAVEVFIITYKSLMWAIKKIPTVN